MKKIKIILLILFIISFSFCIYKILGFIKEDKAAENLKDELIEIVDIPEIPSEDPQTVINFDELKKVNSDVVGWIAIEGTQINYPIVQGKNNSYYLNHSYDKKWSSYGSIFMDYESSKDFSDYNTFIYGHHTKNGSMFGEIYKYMDVNFYQEHPSFYLYTPTTNYIVEVFSVYIADTESDSYNQKFPSIESYKNYLDLIKSKSKYDTGILPKFDTDKIITLYSCSHEYNRNKNDRYFIHGILTKINENED